MSSPPPAAKNGSSRPPNPDETSNRKPDRPPTFAGLGLGPEALAAVERAGD